MMRHGVRVRVLGDLARLPPEVRAAARDVMAATAHHTRCALNICFAYSCAPRCSRPLYACDTSLRSRQLLCSRWADLESECCLLATERPSR